MGVNEPQSFEPALAGAELVEAGDHDLAVIPHDDKVDLALAADEDADLTVCLPGYLAELPGQLMGENPVDGDFAAVELLDAADLACFQPGHVAIEFVDASFSLNIKSPFYFMTPCERGQGTGSREGRKNV